MVFIPLVFVVVGLVLIYAGKRLLPKSSFTDIFVILFLLTVLSGIVQMGCIFIIESFESSNWIYYSVTVLGWFLVIFAAGWFVSFYMKTPFLKASLALIPLWIGFSLVLLPLLYDAFSPHTGRARELAKQAVCKTRLKGLGTAIELYSQAENEYPSNYMDLVEQGYASEKNFQCPSAPKQETISYFYFPPRETDEAETFVMCDYKGNHKDIRNVLMKNGEVKQFSHEEFQAELAQPYNARFAAALKQAEGP